jgi:hypothetical protein
LGAHNGRGVKPRTEIFFTKSLSLGESTVKISAMETENEVSCTGVKIHIPNIPLSPLFSPLDPSEKFRGAALDLDQHC